MKTSDILILSTDDAIRRKTAETAMTMPELMDFCESH